MSMRGHGMGGGGWAGMRSMRQDRSVLRHRVKKGTARRMLTFAVPYRKILAVFIPVVILGAVIAAVNPLILRALIDNGILKKNSTLVIELAILVAILAVFDAGLGLTERRISAYIGESLIYDMRAKVFRHIQRMPLAFFTRTQTGALVSRLNNDVIGAQQAFTDLLSNVVGNLVTVVIVIAAMFFLSWQITLAALILVPLFLVPARIVGRHIGSLTKEGYDLNSEMNMVMQERFQVGGAMLVKLMGRPEAEAQAFEAKAGRVRDIGITQATYARVFFVALVTDGGPGDGHRLRGGRGRRASTATLQVGTVVALTSYLTRLYQPLTQLSNLNLDVMTALVSFERLFEVLDIVPMIDEDPDAVAIPRGHASVEFDRRELHLPERGRGVAGLARVGGRPRDGPAQRGAPPGLLHGRPGPDGRPGRALGRRQDDHLEPRPPPLRRDGRIGAAERGRRAARHHGLGARRRRRGDPGPPPLPRHPARQPACTPGPRRPRPSVLEALGQAQIGHLVGELSRRPRHGDRRARLPAVGRGEAARRPGPAHAQGARRRRPRRGDGAPRLGVRGRGAARPARDAGGAHVRS